MAKYVGVNLEKIQEVKTSIERELIESLVLYDNSIFDKLAINVITDIENADVAYQYMAKSGTTEVYDPDNLTDHPMGYLAPRKLKVTLAVNRTKDNIQYYREKEPFSIAGTNRTFQFPNTEWRIRKKVEQFRGDIIAPLFFGKQSLGKKNPLGLYDGVYTLIDNMINDGEISAENLNYVAIDPMINTGTPGEMYGLFEEWVSQWHPKLREADRVLVYMPSSTKSQLIRDYMKDFTGFQSMEAGRNTFRFVGHENIELVSDPTMGEPSKSAGARMVATVPGNIDFGCDTEADEAFVHIAQGEDPNVLIYHIQSAQGVRIRNIAPDSFCVSSGTNTPIMVANGQYYKDTITLSVNDKTMGTVAADPAKASYEMGETVTLTATAESGYEFVKWSDGATVNPRTIAFSGVPESYQAVFKTAGA